jgi:putative proteasome-type protease
MTYCLGIVTKFGLVMGADSRTNAGVDYISMYQKLSDFSRPGDRVLFICTSGNLSITQAVITLLKRDLKLTGEDGIVNLHTLPSLYEVVRYIGDTIRQVTDHDRQWLKQDGIDVGCSLLVGGQIKGQDTQLYLVYGQGNFIHATPETPFLQIGETKYGKPILDRTLTYQTSLDVAAKCALLSLDSTMRSNISVGPPIRLMMYTANSLEIKHHVQFRAGDPYLIQVRQYWEKALRHAFEDLPELQWEESFCNSSELTVVD